MTITVSEAKAMQQSITQGEWFREDTETHANIDAGDGSAIAMVAKADDADAMLAVPKMLATIIAMGEALQEIERGPIVMFEAGNIKFNERSAIEIARDALTGANNATGK